MSAVVTFSDGSVVAVGTLNNDGSATAFNFTAVSTTSLSFLVTAVSSTTYNVGLSEIMVFGVSTSSLTSSSAGVLAS